MSFQLQYQAEPQGPGWLIKLRASGDFLVVNPAGCGIASVLSPHPRAEDAELIYLGHWCGEPVWLQEDEVTSADTASLRSLADILAPAEFALGSRAMQLLHWRQMHRFCGRCGTATEMSSTELCCHCPSCGASFYPRISPCVIGLVSRGDELLLASHHRH
ncbi:MAG TPA: NADH pyrophosphatase zinc ribbon domain-containing protein, partial [Cellvibrionaceae bacterium]|nr:NADH pyrophosphatase zinc ribbon domain-containing protein [Cellvibrionaceae bacterium]